MGRERRPAADCPGRRRRWGTYLDLREQNQSFSDLAAYFAFYGIGDEQLTGAGEPERLTAVPVSENFFPVLGVQPMLGRHFTDEECQVERAAGGAVEPRAVAAPVRVRPGDRGHGS